MTHRWWVCDFVLDELGKGQPLCALDLMSRSGYRVSRESITLAVYVLRKRGAVIVLGHGRRDRQPYRLVRGEGGDRAISAAGWGLV